MQFAKSQVFGRLAFQPTLTFCGDKETIWLSGQNEKRGEPSPKQR